jgi:[acyl-carrier-protein] S-malonyltransferase
MKKAFLFPGQGSQEVGMAHDLFDASPYFRSLIELGSELTREDIASLCLRGPERKLRQATYLQPALVAVSLGYARCLADHGIQADVVAGHSLGEISALAAAGVVSDRDAVTIAARRGELMDATAATCAGGMLAVLSASPETVRALLDEIGKPDRITVANENAPDQVVVSGELELLQRLSEFITARRLGRAKLLPVAGPWHSPFMSEARNRFEQWIASVEFRAPAVPLVLNATGAAEADPLQIRSLITRQLTSPVYWRRCMETIKAMDVTVLLEVGPGRVLSGLARINGFARETQIHNINNLRGLAHCREETGQPGKE